MTNTDLQTMEQAIEHQAVELAAKLNISVERARKVVVKALNKHQSTPMQVKGGRSPNADPDGYLVRNPGLNRHERRQMNKLYGGKRR